VIGPGHERARPAHGPGFSDAVTFAFGDPERRLFGMARIGLVPGESGTTASTLAVLFHAREPVAAEVSAGHVPSSEEWEAVAAGPLRAEVRRPLESWSVAYDGEEGGFDLEFSARAEPAEFDRRSAPGRLGGVEGYEQLCAVTGTARAGGRTHEVRGPGQRGHQWGRADWEGLSLSRTLSAWLEDDTAVMLSALRPGRARAHDDEGMTAFLVQGGRPEQVAEPRLSTTYDADGRHRRAGLELWPEGEEAMPHRALGQVVCGTTLELGQLRMDLAFFSWLMEGKSGVGRYEVLRRA
jgi:hypothetical protein